MEKSDLSKLQCWMSSRKNESSISVKRIPFSECSGWYFDKWGIHHKSNGFFSIEGITVQTDFGSVHSWAQPIINQPEIGFLGIITKKIDGTLHFLMQAKIEPGNINGVQLSPTLQATKSNYTCRHKGRKPLYLEYFLNARSDQILVDQLQSEQGARFLKKRNRNILIEIDEDIPVHENFNWFTLEQIKKLMRKNNAVNMDTRTVISGINLLDFPDTLLYPNHFSPFGQDMAGSLRQTDGLFSMRNLVSWLSSQKAKYDLLIKPCPIGKMDGWRISDDEISRDDGKYFKVIACNVEITNREVSNWCQPLVQPMQQGLYAFIIRRINGIYHFLVQAKLECGNLDVLELAPTVQCLTGNVYESSQKPPFVDLILDGECQVIYDAIQSEEGGRFFHEQNRNMIVEVDETFPLEVPENYTWMTLGQLHEFLRFNNFLNIQARSLISAIQFA